MGPLLERYRVESGMDLMILFRIDKCQYDGGPMSLREYEMVLKSVADPTRVRILKILEGGEMCVCQLVAILELSQSTVSKHLFLLKMAWLVRERQEKKWVHYSLDGSRSGPYGKKILNCLKGWLEDDPVIGRDRKREALARELGPADICERGRTLPARRAAACCPAPRKEAVGSK
jgi:DNA-binding transcriptional ArsR family regulator